MSGTPILVVDHAPVLGGAEISLLTLLKYLDREEIVRLVSACIREKPAAHWFEKLDAAGIPAGPINQVGQALADVQAQHRAMVRTLGGVSMVGSPVRIDGERADSDLPPPALGEHTAEVLGELGLGAAELGELRGRKVIGCN